MKTRILFVDSQPEALRLFRQLLADQEQDWEMNFLPNAREALDYLATADVEVIFTDARLADMSGLEFLAEVGKRHPRTVRFLLAEEADNALIMECVWNTHQYLSKESSPNTLVAAVHRSVAADSWLANAKLKTLVARMRTLPVLPSIYFEVIKEFNSPDASAQRVGEIIGRDLAITAKIVQMVNSAYFGLPRTITTPGEAVLVLGLETVKSLVLSVHTFAQFDKVKPLYFTADKVWRHSLRVGALARRISELEAGDQKMADDALTAGLFHDMGKLLMAANLPDEYNGAQALAKKQNLPLWEVEKEIFGATHGEAGAYLLGLWGLPLEVVEAVALHHQPARSDGQLFAPLTAVHVANAIDYQQNSETENLTAPVIDLDYLAALGMEGRLADWQESLADPTSRGKSRPKPKSAEPESTPPTPMKPAAEARPMRPAWIWGTAIAGSVALAALLLVLNHQSANERGLAALSAAKLADSSPALPAKESAKLPPPAQIIESPAAALPTRKPAPSDITNTKPVTIASTNNATASADFRLQGILYRKSKPSALINGQTVFVGDNISGGRVVAIDSQSATLEISGQQKVLKLR